MNIHFEIRIVCGVFAPLSEFDADSGYFTSQFFKTINDEQQARALFRDLQEKSSDYRDDSLYGFLQAHFGHEEFDVCNLRIDGLYKVTEEKLK